VQADQVWQNLGIAGKGVVVASLDSGVDWQHPSLISQYRGYTGKLATHEGNWYCATDEGYTYPGDGLGHGTHTTGIMVGQEGIGVAPGATWIAAKVFDNQGFSYDSWIHDGFQWILAPGGDPALAPDVVNSSWGNNFSADQEFLPDVQALRAAGILPVSRVLA
jgi:subtilisin family serine protease